MPIPSEALNNELKASARERIFMPFSFARITSGFSRDTALLKINASGLNVSICCGECLSVKGIAPKS